MNEVSVIITGMVLMVAPVAFVPSNIKQEINAAVVVDGKDFTGKYGMDVSPHNAMFMINDASIDSANIQGPKSRMVKSGLDQQIALDGDRIQFGDFYDINVKPACRAFPVDRANPKAKTAESFRDVPRFQDILLKEAKLLADTAHPDTSDNFNGIDKSLVSAWLEIPDGKLRAFHRHREEDFVEFRPGRHPATVVDRVVWRVPKTAVCVMINPFSNTDIMDTTKVLSVPFKANTKVVAQLMNMGDSTDGDVVEGIGYDFEILYKALKEQPLGPPPLPYAIMDQQRKVTVSGSTGVNCGPASLP